MRSTKGWRIFLLLAAGWGGLLSGCTHSVGPVTGSAVTGGLQGINDPANRRRIEELLTSEQVLRSVRELTRAASDAALAELETPERQERTKKLATDFVRELGPVLGEMIDKDVLPRVQRELAVSVQTVLDQTLSDENRKRTGAFTAGVASQTLEALKPQIASLTDSVSRSIERAVRSALAQDLSPALSRTLDGSAPAISRVMRAATEGTLLGVADAMNGPFGESFRRERQASIAEAQKAAAAERQAWLDELHRNLDESRRWFRMMAIAAAVGGLLMLGIGILLWRVLLENRRLRSGV